MGNLRNRKIKRSGVFVHRSPGMENQPPHRIAEQQAQRYRDLRNDAREFQRRADEPNRRAEQLEREL